MRERKRLDNWRQNGAAAVEFALVLPILRSITYKMSTTRFLLTILTPLAAVAMMMAPSVSSAFEAKLSGPPMPAPFAGKGEGSWAKAGSALRGVAARFRAHEAAGGQAPFDPGNRSIQVRGGLIVIDAIAKGDPATLLSDLQKLGLQDGAQFGGMVSGRMPLSALGRAVDLGTLRGVSASLKPRTESAVDPVYGLVHDGNGAISMRADDVGYTGTGMRVGVLSDTYDNNANPDYDGDGNGEPPATDAVDDLANGDLPADTVILDDSANPGIDEGRAMMQLVHDVIPDASLSFHTAFTGMANFAQGIIDLAGGSTPADVIVDDVIYYAEPMFQDGIIAQAVDQVVAQGVPYFSSAGNAARQSYDAPDGFVNSGERLTVQIWPFAPRDVGALHDFNTDPGITDWEQNITIPTGTMLTVSLQWDQPFASNCAGCSGSQSDMDIYILDQNDAIVASSDGDNRLSGDPVEVAQFHNTGSGTAFRILITHFDVGNNGPAPGRLKYVWYGSSGAMEYVTDSPTTYGHANAAGAEAIGAAFYLDTPKFGVNPAVLESYSSAGGVPILFTVNGTPQAAEVREKPEVVGPDGTNTTFFYRDTSFDDADEFPETFPNFFGTSAAAPHVAAVAAQMLQANSTLTPADIYSALESTALDMGTTAGFDFDTGYGFVQADAALALVGGSINLSPTAAFTHSCANLACDFTDGSSDEDGWIASWDWDFGDGNSSTQQSPQDHGYAATNTYTVTLTVTDNGGRTNSTSQDVSVTAANTAPTVTITAPAANATYEVGDPVSMTGFATDIEDDNTTLTAALTWTDNDTPIGSGAGFTITAGLSEGQHVIKASVTDSGEVADSTSVTLDVNPAGTNQPPVAVANSNQPQPATSKGKDATGPVTLFGVGSSDPEDDAVVVPLTYLWSWQGNDLSTEMSPTVNLPKGTHTITLKVTDSGGGFDTTTTCVEIYNKNPAYTCPTAPPPATPPVASFTKNCGDYTCIFTDTSQDEGSISTWSWDFGDGNSSTAQNPTHEYGFNGPFSVMLTVNDNDGDSDTDTQSVDVPVAASQITLTAVGSKSKGNKIVDLSWTVSSASTFDIYRGGSIIATTTSGTAYRDDTLGKGGGSYDYQVCDQVTNNCSDTETVIF